MPNSFHRKHQAVYYPESIKKNHTKLNNDKYNKINTNSKTNIKPTKFKQKTNQLKTNLSMTFMIVIKLHHKIILNITNLRKTTKFEKDKIKEISKDHNSESKYKGSL